MRAGERLSSRIDEISESMVERIIAEVPTYRRVPPEVIADVRELAHRNSQVLAETLASRGRLDRRVLDYVAEHVRRRLHVGMGLESMLHAYRVGLSVFWEECMAEAIELGLSRDAALDLLRTTFELSEMLTTHAAGSYVREESRLRARSEQASRDLLEVLILGDVDPASTAPHLAAPGIDPQGDLYVVVGRVEGAPGSRSDALAMGARSVTDDLSTGRVSPLLAVRQGSIVAVVPAETDTPVVERLAQSHDRLLRDAEIELFFGVSPPCGGFGCVPVGFEQAALAASRASRERPVVVLADLPAIEHLMMGATSTTRSLLMAKASHLSELKPNEIAAMRETLHAVAYANLNLTHAADALHVHPNTLRYRLSKIQERTDQDPRTFGGVVELLCIFEVLDGAARDDAIST